MATMTTVEVVQPMREKLLSKLQVYGQEHLIAFWDRLNAQQQADLQSQIDQIDLPQLSKLTKGEDHRPDWNDLAHRAEPPQAVRLHHPSPKWSEQQAREAGREALRSGKIGMILAAGGQGTRLGFDLPKGMFPIGPLSGRSLFQMHIDRLRAVSRRYAVSIPMYVMTSPATDLDTRAFLEANDRFGLDENELIVFCQGSMPAVDDKSGKILLAAPGQIALSPDGHGGLVAALEKSGSLADADTRGIKHFFYAQVDNPLVDVCDPVLIGHHLLAESQMTTQVVQKRFALEKVGNVVSIDGRTQIIEYSDLASEYAEQRQADGSLKLWAGNIAVHLFEADFLRSVVEHADGLPFHRAHKPVPHVSANGELVRPQQANAIKFERFVFDLLPMAERTIVVEGDAAKVFAPVKNANGAATDTPLASQQAISSLHRSWLRQAGATISDDIVVEIHPLWALDADEVREKLPPNTSLRTDTYFS